MNRARAAFSALALLVSVAGCTHSIEGTATPASVQGSADSPSNSPTGASVSPSSTPATPTGSASPSSVDYRTADPCSFLTKDAFDKIIKNSTGQLNNSEYSTCGLRISGVAGKKAVSWEINLDMSSTFTSAEQLEAIEQVPVSTRQLDGTAVFTGESKAAGCLRAFQLPDVDATLMMIAKGKSLQCQAADAVLTSALNTVSTKAVGHYRLSKKSLGGVDICAEFLPQVTSLLDSDVTAGPSGVHGCQWTAGKLAVMATVTAAGWPPSGYPASAKQKTVAGHPTVSATSESAQGFFAQGAINFGAGTVGKEGMVDQLSVIATQTGSGDTVKSGFQDLLASLAHSKLS